MKEQEQQSQASRIDAALQGKGQAVPEDLPYVRLGQALKDDAKSAVLETLDPEVAKRQRVYLLQMAKNLKETRQKQAAAHRSTEKSVFKRHWSMYVGTLAAVCAVAILMFVSKTGPFTPKSLLRQSASTFEAATLSLIIPEAHAADAFSLMAENQTGMLAAVDTSFKITSKVPLDASALEQSLRIVSVSQGTESQRVPFVVEPTGDSSYSVKPTEALDPGKVYKLTIAAKVEGQDGTYDREFSWAVQTQNDFRVLASVPADRTTGVPVDTSLEFTLSQMGWADPAASFSIAPEVKGRFETHGRKLVFLPEKPLKHGTLYTVILKRGWGVSGGKSLTSDVIVRFETETEQRVNPLYFMPQPRNVEMVPGANSVIYVDASDDLVGKQVTVTLYKITAEQLQDVMMKTDAVPAWVTTERVRDDAMASVAKTLDTTLTVTLERLENEWRKVLHLPNLAAGFYAIKLEAQNAPVAWVAAQVTEVAAYAMADRSHVVVWVADVGRRSPMGGAQVTVDGKDYFADGQGLVKIQTPPAWVAAVNDEQGLWQETKPLYVHVKTGTGLVLPVRLTPRWYGPGSVSASDLVYWSYVFPDRPLYRTSDVVKFSGLLQDRVSGSGAGAFALELRGSGIDFGTFGSKTYAHLDLQTDKQGFFSGEMAWRGALKPGYYELTLIKDGRRVSSRTIEVRDLVKPAYVLAVLPDAPSIYAGDKARGRVRATFYDGTPLAKAKLIMNTFGGFGDNKTVELTTDDGGYATYEINTEKPGCDLLGDYPQCNSRETLYLEVRPAEGEEAGIVAYASVDVWRGRVNFSMETQKEDGGDAFLTYRVRGVDLSKASGHDQEQVLTAGKQNVTIRVHVIEQRWEQVQTGVTYDPIEKKSVPQYRFERRDTDKGYYEAKTDADGRATVHFPMMEGLSYRVVATANETSELQHAVMAYAARGWYARDGEINVTLKSATPEGQKNAYTKGEKVSVVFTRGGQRITANDGTFLFVVAARGLLSETATAEPSYDMTVADAHAPNFTIYGIALLSQGFVHAQYDASVDYTADELNVSVQADQPSYAPGETVGLRVKVTKNGSPVANAHVTLSAADEALLSIANLDTEERPLESINHWVGNGIIVTQATHSSEPEFFGGGGAEMGGGGEKMMVVRSNFKDVAAYLNLVTGSDGVAVGSFTAPDNITNWRLTATALTSDRVAGTARLGLPVTKPLFVDAVVPDMLLVSDSPVLKLRAFGSALPKDGQIQYTVDIPSLGVNNQNVSEQSGRAVYLALDKLAPGDHEATIGVSAGDQNDAIKKTIRVRESHATHDERVQVELAPGVTLPDVGASREIRAVIESKARSAARGRVEALVNPWSARLESQVASKVAARLLHEYFSGPSEDDASLVRYQRSSGGLAPLPYASEDVELSSRVAAQAPDAFDRNELANYFWQVTDDVKSVRADQIQALSGLAALGEPVLDRLAAAAQIKDLDWRERFAVMRGMEAAGQREAASALLESVLMTAKEQDGRMWLEVGDLKADNLDATAQAAALAAAVANPKAESLMSYVENNWSDEALTDLERAHYLQKIVPQLPQVDVQVVYLIGQDSKIVDLKQKPVAYINLTTDEAAALRVVSVNGPATLSFIRRVTGEAKNTTDAFVIERQYSVAGKPLGVLREGDIVDVTLMPRWNAKSQDGCYLLRDRLPATFVPMLTVAFNQSAENVNDYPYDVCDSEVSFVTCKQTHVRPIRYRVRVVSLGKYSAEGAILQSMDTPSAAALSTLQTVEVK